MIVDGFIIYNSNANGSGNYSYHDNLFAPQYIGGGILLMGNSTLTKIRISNCVFTSNSAADYGAAVYSQGTGLLITDCAFSGNSTGLVAAGIYSDNTRLTLTNCIFSHNGSP